MSEHKPGEDKPTPPKTTPNPGLGETMGLAGGLPVPPPPKTTALSSKTLEGLLAAELEAKEKGQVPANPDSASQGPTVTKATSHPGLGEKIGVAGGVPAPAPPSTTALRSQTLEGIMLDQLEAMEKAEAQAKLVPGKKEAAPPLTPGLGEVMATAGGLPPVPVPEAPDLELRLRKPRTLFSAVMSLVAGVMALIAMVPLVSVLLMLIYRGGQRLSLALFVELPPAAGSIGGGIGNALLGTLLMVGIAAAIAVPVGILAAVFLAEFGPRSRTSGLVRFTAKVLSGLPSVLAGLFAYAAVVILTGRYSAVAGGIALAMLMIPTILLTAEQAIKMVPQRMREAAIGMGCTQTQVVWNIVLPTATPGLLTGIMLAVARAAGETAPLLFTALFSDYWLTRNPMEPTASLAVLIFNFSSSPFKNQIEIAWAASLVLVVIILCANVAAQVWTSRAAKR